MEPEKNSMTLPLAIIVGFGLIAAAIFLRSPAPNTDIAPTPTDAPAPQTIRTVTEEDYILGNPNASILIIEYSDYECPQCAQFHDTMRSVMDEYGISGRVAWVYRQFPLIGLHPNAPVISEAALCVGDLGGDPAFWKFSDTVFDSRVDSEPTNVTRLSEFAIQAGVSVTEFQECIDSDRMMDNLKADMQDGLVAGAQGTPFTVIKVGDQEVPITGAQNYQFMKGVLDDILSELDGVSVSETES